MAEVANGQANLAQFAIQGNYRAATAQDMAKVYSRNLEQQKLPVCAFAQKSVNNNTSLESVKNDTPVFSYNAKKMKWRSPIPNFKAGFPEIGL